MQAPNAFIKFNKDVLRGTQTFSYLHGEKKKKDQQLNWDSASKILSEPWTHQEEGK